MWSLPPVPPKSLNSTGADGQNHGASGAGVSSLRKPCDSLAGGRQSRTNARQHGPASGTAWRAITQCAGFETTRLDQGSLRHPDPMLLRSPNGGTRSHFRARVLSPRPHTDVHPRDGCPLGVASTGLIAYLAQGSLGRCHRRIIADVVDDVTVIST